MRIFTKWMSLALALMLCLGGTAALAESAPAFTEAPFLTEQGIYGDVTDRLPVAGDVMVEDADYLTVGTYGGELKRSAGGGNWDAGKIIEEGLFRFTTSGTVEPNVAKGYTVSEDATVYTITLREGMKWSDGEPFTAEDCVWFYNAVCLNSVDGKGVRNCHKDANGDPAVVEKVDDVTFTVTFGTPKYDFIEALTVDLKWHYAPKHIFEEMVQDVIDGKTDEALAIGKEICGTEFTDVGKMGKEMLYYFWNYPGIPTLNPFVLSTEEGKNSIKGDYYEYVRNPYYWKVDTAGQQLPYMDKIIYTTVSNVDQQLMLLLDGTVDLQTVAMESIPTILESQTAINIYEWSGSDWGNVPTQLHLNLNADDAHLRELFNNADFRQGLSICVDREEFASLYSDGWLKGGQAAPQPGTMGYSEAWASKWTEYDVEKAKGLFESAGLVMGSDGFYDFADGTDFVLNIVSVADNGAADTYKILEPYFRAAGIKCTFKDSDRSNIDNDLMANAVEAMLYPVTGIGDVSIILKPNSMVPGYATNVAWYGTMNESTATGDLLKLIELKKQVDVTSDPDARNEIALQMLKLHEENMWTLGYVEASPTYHAVNARIKNFLEDGVWSDIYRDMGIAHVQCWYIGE
ncbi:MAG: ABC transporter substrate-binding protein [Eubacteriales bacterium]|nr:ABC transporter substrate-binding protein [Eubacteriales bacterium]